MRASVACRASAQRERADHRGGSAPGALPYVVEKSVFDVCRGLAFEIVDMHSVSPKSVSGATSSETFVPTKIRARHRRAMEYSKL